MSHFKEFMKSKASTYLGVSCFIVFFSVSMIMWYQEKLNFMDLLKTIGGEMLLLIPILYKFTRKDKNEKDN